MEEGVDQRPSECCDIEPKGDIGGEAAIEDRKVWADERLRGGKATGNYVLKWKSARGEELKYKCIMGYNRWGENVGRVLVAMDHYMLKARSRPRVLCVGSLVFAGTAEHDDALMKGSISEFSINCDGVIGNLSARFRKFIEFGILCRS